MEGYLEVLRNSISNALIPKKSYADRDFERLWVTLHNQELSFYEMLDLSKQIGVNKKKTQNVRDVVVEKMKFGENGVRYGIRLKSSKGSFIKIFECGDPRLCVIWEESLNIAANLHVKDEIRYNERMSCFYDLGLDPSVPLSASMISRAFKRKALKAHPDKGGDPAAFDRIKQSQMKLLSIQLEEQRWKPEHVLEYEAVVEKSSNSVGMGLDVEEEDDYRRITVAEVDPLIRIVSCTLGDDESIAVGDVLAAVDDDDASEWFISRLKMRLNSYRVPVGQQVRMKFKRSLWSPADDYSPHARDPESGAATPTAFGSRSRSNSVSSPAHDDGNQKELDAAELCGSESSLGLKHQWLDGGLQRQKDLYDVGNMSPTSVSSPRSGTPVSPPVSSPRSGTPVSPPVSSPASTDGHGKHKQDTEPRMQTQLPASSNTATGSLGGNTVADDARGVETRSAFERIRRGVDLLGLFKSSKVAEVASSERGGEGVERGGSGEGVETGEHVGRRPAGDHGSSLQSLSHSPVGHVDNGHDMDTTSLSPVALSEWGSEGCGGISMGLSECPLTPAPEQLASSKRNYSDDEICNSSSRIASYGESFQTLNATTELFLGNYSSLLSSPIDDNTSNILSSELSLSENRTSDVDGAPTSSSSPSASRLLSNSNSTFFGIGHPIPTAEVGDSMGMSMSTGLGLGLGFTGDNSMYWADRSSVAVPANSRLVSTDSDDDYRRSSSEKHTGSSEHDEKDGDGGVGVQESDDDSDDAASTPSTGPPDYDYEEGDDEVEEERVGVDESEWSAFAWAGPVGASLSQTLGLESAIGALSQMNLAYFSAQDTATSAPPPALATVPAPALVTSSNSTLFSIYGAGLSSSAPTAPEHAAAAAAAAAAAGVANANLDGGSGQFAPFPTTSTALSPRTAAARVPDLASLRIDQIRWPKNTKSIKRTPRGGIYCGELQRPRYIITRADERHSDAVPIPDPSPEEKRLLIDDIEPADDPRHRRHQRRLHGRQGHQQHHQDHHGHQSHHGHYDAHVATADTVGGNSNSECDDGVDFKDDVDPVNGPLPTPRQDGSTGFLLCMFDIPVCLKLFDS